MSSWYEPICDHGSIWWLTKSLPSVVAFVHVPVFCKPKNIVKPRPLRAGHFAFRTDRKNTLVVFVPRLYRLNERALAGATLLLTQFPHALVRDN